MLGQSCFLYLYFHEELSSPERTDSAPINKVYVHSPSEGRGGGVLLGLIFAGYVPLVSQSPYSIIVYSLANCRPHLSHFWANM